MRIICEKCKTEYSLDEERLAPTGSPFRCTQCGHVFKAVPPQKKKSTGNSLARTNRAVPWMLQHRSGETKKFIDTKKLQNYIADGKADGLDLVSRFGGPWKEVADTTELKGYLRSSHFPDAHPHGQGTAGSSSQTTRQPTIRGNAVTDDAVKKNRKDTLPPAATSPWTATIREGRPARNSEEPTTRQKTVRSGLSSQSTHPPAGMRTASSSRQATVGGMPPGKSPASSTLPKTEAKPVVKSVLPTVGGMPSSIPPQQDARPAEKPLKSSPTPATSTLAGNGPRPAENIHSESDPMFAQTTATTPDQGKKTSLTGKPRAEISGELDFSSVPATSEDRWTTGGDAVRESEPGWTKSSSSVSPVPDGASMYESSDRKRGWVYLVAGAATALVLASAYLFVFQKDFLTSKFGAAQNGRTEEHLAALLLEAREKMLLDTEADFTQAERIYQQILNIQANHIDALVQMAQLHAIWAERLQDEYLDATSEDQTDGQARPQTLKSSYDARLNDALQYINRALSLAPDNPGANVVAAQIKVLQGSINDAEAYLEEGRSSATIQDVSYVTALIGIHENQNHAEIIGMLKSIVVAEPRLRVLYRLARVQLSDGQTEDAIDSISRILKLNSKHTAALALKERAIEGKTVALLPPTETTEESDSDIEMEISEDEVNNDVAAVKTATQAPATNGAKEVSVQKPGLSAEALLRKASAAQASGRSQEAINLYTQVLEKDPSNIEAINGMGYVSMDRGSRGQAIARFKRALSINPGFGPSQIGMAQTYKFMGQKAEALKWFEKYLSSNPGGRHAGMAQRNIDELKSEASSPAVAKSAATSDNDASGAESDEKESSGAADDKIAPPPVAADTGDSTPPATTANEEKEPSPPPTAAPSAAPSPPPVQKPDAPPKADGPVEQPTAPAEKAAESPADKPANAE
jgi:predicted Zn finger-like uncharacterized protein